MRTKPYTARGIRRLTCFRKGCTNKAHAQWTICADGNRPRPICQPCDHELNAMVTLWAFGAKEARRMMKDYAERAA